MKIVVLGAGAMGGYIGGRLAEAGLDVTFVVREARREQLARDGLRIESCYGDLSIPVNAVAPGAADPNPDIVLLTCKAYALDDAIETIRPSVGPDTAVLPVLNGIRHIDTLNAAFGAERVLAGTVQISAARQPDGTIRHMNDWRWLRFGEQAGGLSNRVVAIRDAIAPATGLEPVALDDAMQEMWEKFVHLATAAGMTCLMRANVGQIVRSYEGKALFAQLLATVAEVAARAGHPPAEDFLDRYRTLFADPAATYATSMLRDIEAGNPTEGEHILGMLLERVREYGIDDPLPAIVYAHIRAYEERRADGGL